MAVSWRSCVEENKQDTLLLRGGIVLVAEFGHAYFQSAVFAEGDVLFLHLFAPAVREFVRPEIQLGELVVVLLARNAGVWRT